MYCARSVLGIWSGGRRGRVGLTIDRPYCLLARGRSVMADPLETAAGGVHVGWRCLSKISLGSNIVRNDPAAGLASLL